MDCVYETINSKMPEITVKDIFVCNGISNSILSFQYANTWFDVVDGRGIGNPIDVLKALKIPFSILDVNEFFENKFKKNCIIFASKDLLMQYKGIDPRYKQLLFFYSSFFVASDDGEKVVLSVYRDDTSYSINREELDFVSNLSTFPFERAVYIVQLEDMSYKLNPSYIRLSLLENINLFLSNAYEEERFKIKITGKKMYEHLISVFEQYVECKQKNLKVDIMRQQILISSINVGSVGLYRQEFAEALVEVLGVNDEKIVGNLLKSANAWRELGRKLAHFQKNKEYISEDFLNDAIPIVEKIKEMELSAMEELKQYLIGDSL